MSAAPVAPELEAVVEAAVRAVLHRHRRVAERSGRPVDADAVVRDALAALRPLVAVLAPPARAPAGGVIVERDVLAAEAAGRLVVARGAVVTPLARDTAAERGIELVVEGAA